MTDFNLVDPQGGWECDLHSVYAAYIGHFQLHGVQWWNKSWGSWFASFERFLEFGWPVIVVTDVWSFQPHIVTKMAHVDTFLRMIRTRFGESLAVVSNILRVRPFEKKHRPLRQINDLAFYKKIHATLPAASLGATKARIRSGEAKTIEDLWNKKDKTFLAIDFEWSERNPATCLEWGYAALRAGPVASSGTWPADPDINYRTGHYVVSEYVDTVVNKHCPTHPRDYMFGKTQYVPKSQLVVIIQAIIDSLASPESESIENTLVLVAHGAAGDLEKLAQLKIKIPNNVFVLDTTSFERQLFYAGRRPPMLDPTTGLARQSGSTLSLANLLRSCGIDTTKIVFHNSGNDAYAALLALQMLLEPETKSKHLGGGQGLPLAIDSRNDSRANEDKIVAFSGFAVVKPNESNPAGRDRRRSLGPSIASPTIEARPAAGRGSNRGGRGRGGAQQRNSKIEDAMNNLFL